MDKMYIDAEYITGTQTLRIFATDALQNYEMEQTEIEIKLSLELGCTTLTRPLLFRLTINEANNHSPTFLKSHYDIEISLPLPNGFDLSFFEVYTFPNSRFSSYNRFLYLYIFFHFKTIMAHDYDLRNNAITFSSTDSGAVTVGTSNAASVDGKTFVATLVLNQQLLVIHDKLEFTIIGTVN